MAEEIDYGTTGKPHPYHLVRPSIWPLVGAFSAGLLAIGAIMYMHGVEFAGQSIGLKGVIIGLFAVLATMFFRWKDIIFEAEDLAIHFGGIKAVDGLSVQVEKGSIFTIIGPKAGAAASRQHRRTGGASNLHLGDERPVMGAI